MLKIANNYKQGTGATGSLVFMSYIRILRLEYLWTLLPTRNTYRQRFINYRSRFLSLPGIEAQITGRSARIQATVQT